MAKRAATYLALGSAVSTLGSIAVSQILLGAAIVALLASREHWRVPPVWLPLSLFLGGTLLSLALSPEASLANPQVKKMYAYLMLPVMFTAVRDLSHLRRWVQALIAVAATAALWSLGQFAWKVAAARRLGAGVYEYYIGERTTGYMSHWMTFGAQMMFALLLAMAFLMFGFSRRRGIWMALLGLLGTALVAGLTRNIWLGAAAGSLYLAACWRPRVLFLTPLLAVLLFAEPVRERAISVLRPTASDSNQHRIVCWRIGWEIIRAHPWLGLGPDRIRNHWESWVPADIPRPLPPGYYQHLHSIYVHYAADRGILVMLALVWMLVQVLFDFLRAVRKLPASAADERFLLHGGVAVVIATMIAGAFEVNLGDSEVLMLFLAIVAAGYVACERAHGAARG